MNELQPITKELIDSLDGVDKYIARKRYHAWLKDIRKRDKQVVYNEDNRIRRFKTKQHRVFSKYFNGHHYSIIVSFHKDGMHIFDSFGTEVYNEGNI